MPITKEQRDKFTNESAIIQGKINQIMDEIKNLDSSLSQKEEFEIPYIQFTICEKLLDIVELYLSIHDIHMKIIGLKHENSLMKQEKK